MNTLAQRLKYARELANLSQQEVAKRANISQPTYFKIENGSTLKPRNILEIAHALNVNVDWLATGEGEMKDSNTNYSTPTTDYEPSTSTIELIETLKEMEKTGELTPQVVGLLNATLNTVKSVSTGKRLSVAHLVESSNE